MVEVRKERDSDNDKWQRPSVFGSIETGKRGRETGAWTIVEDVDPCVGKVKMSVGGWIAIVIPT